MGLPHRTMLRIAALVACVASASAFAPGAMSARPMQLKGATSTCKLPVAAARPAAKTQLNMGLESVTDTDGALGGLKPLVFFGASFFPSLFLAGYFLGGYYPKAKAKAAKAAA